MCGTYITALVKKRGRNPWHLKRFVFQLNVKKIYWPRAIKDKMRRRDISRMWAQIVKELGEDKYTSQQWQEGYEDFWRCMLSNSEPFIRIESVSTPKIFKIFQYAYLK